MMKAVVLATLLCIGADSFQNSWTVGRGPGLSKASSALGNSASRTSSWVVLRSTADESPSPKDETAAGQEAAGAETEAAAEAAAAAADGEAAAEGPEGEAEASAGEDAGAAEGGGAEEEAVEEKELSPEEQEMAAVQEEIRLAEIEVANARKRLNSAIDVKGDSGQTGYLRIAAKVQDYKNRIAESKKEQKDKAIFSVTKSFADVMDEMERAESEVPPADEAQQGLHNSYQVLARDMREKFSKFGLEEFHAAVGEAFNPSKHEDMTGEDHPAPAEAAKPGCVASEVAPGLRMKAGIVRKAGVTVVPKEAEPPAPAPETEPAME